MTPEERYAKSQHGRYEATLENVAARLRAVVERVELEGRPVATNGVVDYVYRANNALHELLWGVANAHPDSLITVASDASAAAAAVATTPRDLHPEPLDLAAEVERRTVKHCRRLRCPEHSGRPQCKGWRAARIEIMNELKALDDSK
ncbi:MAG TPA: hypothetical protein VK631_14545 [Solirubrobacteraceae bacterium]|nr:hypothetical protein [Solirubrobacteraceae bacterium]